MAGIYLKAFMGANISKHLSFLLCRNKIAVLPGLGAFIATDCHANADYVAGKIYPPASAIEFNENYRSGNDALLQQLINMEGISTSEAENYIEQFVSQIRNEVHRGEKADLPEIGSFLLDSSGSLVFYPVDFAAFNLQSYGLPILAFKPLTSRHKGAISNQAPGEKAKVTENIPGFAASKPWFKRPAVSYGSFTFLVLVLLSVIFSYRDTGSVEDSAVHLVPTGDVRVNVKPVADAPIEKQPTQNLESGIAIDSSSTSKSALIKVESKGAALVVKEKTKSENSKTIIVGTFSQAENVRRVVARLKSNHFQVFRKKAGKLTRVGAVIVAEDEVDQKQAIAQLQKMFGKEIWELEKESK